MRRLTLHAALIGVLLVVFGAGSYAVADGGKKNMKTERHDRLPGGTVGLERRRREVQGDDRRLAPTRSPTSSRTRASRAPSTQAHIHFAQRSVNGGISVWLCETATNPSPPRQHARLPGRAARSPGRSRRPMSTGSPPAGPAERRAGHRSGRVRGARRGDPRGRDVRERPLGQVPGRRDPRPAQRPESARRLGRPGRVALRRARLRPGSRPCSRRAITARPNSAARAPSTTRWSNVSAT